MIVGADGRGRADLTNLPRKINIAISSTRDDFPHTQINDIGLEAVVNPADGKVRPAHCKHWSGVESNFVMTIAHGIPPHTHTQVGFNLQVGGYFSLKRNIMSIPAPFSVSMEQLMPFTEAVLTVFRCVCLGMCVCVQGYGCRKGSNGRCCNPSHCWHALACDP